MKTYLAKKETVQRQWRVIDAEGQVLGRLAVKVANALRGRDKPGYTPHVDTGDFVVVVNADKIVLTGKKREQKSYMFYSGYVGNAVWTGAPLRLVLEQAGIGSDAVEVVLEAADRGTPGFAPGEVAYAKSIPVDKALHPDTLLVYEMNGEPLPREHGGPVRVLTPGWYGTYNVKWIKRLTLVDQPFEGVFMTRLWRIREREGGFVEPGSVTRIAVKSLIFTPAEGAALAAGEEHVIRGAAWSGGQDIASVEVSTDGGASWRFADLLPRSEHGSVYAWRQWELAWRPDEPGSHVLMARATDTSGAAQPFAYDLDLNGFAVNHVQPVSVEVT